MVGAQHLLPSGICQGIYTQKPAQLRIVLAVVKIKLRIITIH
jgi:hypothetical protein